MSKVKLECPYCGAVWEFRSRPPESLKCPNCEKEFRPKPPPQDLDPFRYIGITLSGGVVTEPLFLDWVIY